MLKDMDKAISLIATEIRRKEKQLADLKAVLEILQANQDRKKTKKKKGKRKITAGERKRRSDGQKNAWAARKKKKAKKAKGSK